MVRFRLSIYLMVILIATVLFGCGRTNMVVAKRYPVDQKMIPEFTSDNGITLINAQKDQSAFLMGKQFDHKFVANLHQYTEIAIETLEGELKNKNIPVEPNAEKKLRIAVTKVHFEERWLKGFLCDAFIEINTDDGYTAEIDGHDTNAWILLPCIYGALNHAVVAVLNDDKVIEYLKR